MDLHGKIDLDAHPVADRSLVRETVPVIDIRSLEDGSAAVDEIAAACRDLGFFQVVGHSVPQALIDQVWKKTREFFGSPAQNRAAVLRSRDNPWGYYNNELTKNQRDKKEVFDYTTPGVDGIYGAENRWPSHDPAFRTVMLQYLEAVSGLSLRLLHAFCLGLGLPGKFLDPDFDGNHTGFVRLNHYPVEDPLRGSDIPHMEEADMGVHHHSDAGALTVLLQDDIGGLQVHHDNHWHDVPPLDSAFVINTGDMMQVWSNDRYRSPVHRVLPMRKSDRYSLPFFFNPSAAAKVSPLPSLLTPDNPARYRTIEWAQFRGKRTDGDYANYGTEVQIGQYRLP
ncbi:MAG: hypothetical protein KJO31_00025 [Gammaproteobacteria bacterium]|nr:hypothetical protein [Gammaproteobacteria bacterium]